MRLDTPVFIPRNTAPVTLPQDDAARWLALETVCTAWQQAGHSAEPIDHIAARVLDGAGSELESHIALLALRPSNYGIRHEGTLVPHEALDAFHRVILHRQSLQDQIVIDHSALAKLVRSLTHLPSRWLSDDELLDAIPSSLMAQLKKSLTSIIAPAASPKPSGLLVANEDALQRALDNGRHFWREWAGTVSDHALPPAPPEPAANRLTGFINAMATQPADNLLTHANHALDRMGLAKEDALWFKLQHARLDDTEQLRIASQLKPLMATRETARIDWSALAQSLTSQPGLAGNALACLFLPERLTSALARSAAGLHHTGVPTQAAMDAALGRRENDPRLAHALNDALTQAHDTLPRLQARSNALPQLLQAMLDHIDAPTPDLHQAARAAVLGRLDPFSNVSAKDVAGEIAAGLPLLGETTGSGAAVRPWAMLLMRAADAHCIEVSSALDAIESIGLGRNNPLALMLAEGACLPQIDRGKLSRALLARLQALPLPAREALLQKCPLAEPKIPPAIRDQLKAWRNSGEHRLAALADLYERLASRVRESVKLADARAQEDEQLINAVIEEAQSRAAESFNTPRGSELSRLTAAMPATGDPASRRTAVRKYLQNLSPLGLCTLLIETSNVNLSQKMVMDLGRGRVRIARNRKREIIDQIMPQTRHLLQNGVPVLNLGQVRDMFLHALAHDPEFADIARHGPAHKVATRLVGCLDNLALYAVSISLTASPEVQRNAIIAQGLPPALATAEHIDQAWVLSIRRSLLANAQMNYSSLRQSLSNIKELGEQLVGLWEDALDRFGAKFANDQSCARLYEDDALIGDIAQDTVNELGRLLGPALFMLRQVPSYAHAFREVSENSLHIAGAPDRSNPGAVFAHFMGERMCEANPLFQQELVMTI